MRPHAQGVAGLSSLTPKHLDDAKGNRGLVWEPSVGQRFVGTAAYFE
jgi:hypothetical protein